MLPGTAMNQNYITNFTTLRSMGDRLMTSLTKNLRLSTPAVEAAEVVANSGYYSWTVHWVDRNRSVVATSGSCSWAVHWTSSKLLTAWALILLATML